MGNQEKILEIVKEKGPLLPVHVAKEIEVNILMASAMLSELVSNKLIKISHIKVGGSPLYYISGQEHKLQNFYDKLNDKEKKAFNLIKIRRVLQDSRQEPVIRAALRQIRDFAKPIEVVVGKERKIFWRWYMLSNNEIKSIIRSKIKEKAETKPETKPETITKRKDDKERGFVDTTVSDVFFLKVKTFFKDKKIEVFTYNIIRKNSDIEFTIAIPTSVGPQRYYCRAKNKKKCNDGDLSAAYVKGEFKKLPVLFITTGEFTKKTKEMLNNEFKNITIKKI